MESERRIRKLRRELADAEEEGREQDAEQIQHALDYYAGLWWTDDEYDAAKDEGRLRRGR